MDAGRKIEEKKLSDYFYQVDFGIVRYDTYKEVEDNTTEIISDFQETKESGNKADEDIETYYIKKRHTIVGGLIQNTLGFNRTVTRNLSSHRRIKVSFSNPNYLVLSYISASITYQKKNWVGWSKTECEKLAFGWDGLIITLEGAPAFKVMHSHPSERIGNFNFPFSNKTYFGLYLPSFKLYFTDKWYFTIPSQSITFSQKDLHNAFKEGFMWVKNHYGEPASQVATFPNPNKMIVGPEERVRTNAGHMSETFQWVAGASFKWNTGSPVGIGNFSTSPLKFVVNQGSIYGKAYGSGKCMGVRITKDW